MHRPFTSLDHDKDSWPHTWYHAPRASEVINYLLIEGFTSEGKLYYPPDYTYRQKRNDFSIRLLNPLDWLILVSPGAGPTL